MAENKGPYVPFYTADFLIGVSGMTMSERGQYITLLCLQHQRGRLSEKDIRLAVKKPSENVLEKFIKDENGLYYNSTMELRTKQREQYIESRKNNGMQKHIKSSKNGAYATPYASGMQVHSDIDIDIDNIYGKYNNVILTKEELIELQQEFPQNWNDKIEYLSEFMASTGKTYESHLATIRLWDKQDKEKAAKKHQGKPPDKPRYGNFDPEEALEAAIRRSRGEA